MTDDNRPAKIWADPGNYDVGDLPYGAAGYCWWSHEEATTPYIRKPRWRTVGEDGMPEAGREVFVTREGSNDLWKTQCKDVGWRISKLVDFGAVEAMSTDRWVYLDEVLEILE